MPFACVGGPTKRSAMVAPSWIAEADREEYLRAYRAAAKESYGDDWETCSFGWAPAAEVGGANPCGACEEDKRTPHGTKRHTCGAPAPTTDASVPSGERIGGIDAHRCPGCKTLGLNGHKPCSVCGYSADKVAAVKAASANIPRLIWATVHDDGSPGVAEASEQAARNWIDSHDNSGVIVAGPYRLAPKADASDEERALAAIGGKVATEGQVRAVAQKFRLIETSRHRGIPAVLEKMQNRRCSRR